MPTFSSTTTYCIDSTFSRVVAGRVPRFPWSAVHEAWRDAVAVVSGHIITRLAAQSCGLVRVRGSVGLRRVCAV